ncbi:MAG: carboxypeptidase-like regulatory domain-containing protein [Bacteroidota bacterium]
MKHTRLPFVLGCAVVMLALTAAAALAQSTGAIKGKVTDQRTGDPLPFANIVVKGTTTGAATDVNGSYEIKNLAAGKTVLVP